MSKKNSIRGRKSRAAGARFELKARCDLEKKGWIVAKWMNNVDLDEKKLMKVRNKFLGPGRPMMLGAGFPDFICFRKKGSMYEIMGMEAKGNGWLDKNEKEKCKFLLDKDVFGKILIAKKGKKRGEIEYIDFSEKYD
jgi:hypothetical protein